MPVDWGVRWTGRGTGSVPRPQEVLQPAGGGCCYHSNCVALTGGNKGSPVPSLTWYAIDKAHC